MVLLGLVGVALAGSAEAWKLSWQEISATAPLNTGAVHQGLEQVKPALIGCLQDPRMSVPEVMTAIDLRWRVDKDGVARNLIVQGIELAGSELEPCLGAAMRGVSWSGPGAEGARLSARIGLERAAEDRCAASLPRGSQGEARLRPMVIAVPSKVQVHRTGPPSAGSELEPCLGATMHGVTWSVLGAEDARLSAQIGIERAAEARRADIHPRFALHDPTVGPTFLAVPSKVQAQRKVPPSRPPQLQVRLISSYASTAPSTPTTTRDWLSRDSMLFACYQPYLSEGPLRVRLVGEVDRAGEVRWHRAGRDVRGEVAACAQHVFSAQEQVPGTRLDFTLDFWPTVPPPPAPAAG